MNFYPQVEADSVKLHSGCSLKYFRVVFLDKSVDSVTGWGKEMAHIVFIWPGEGSGCQETNTSCTDRLQNAG